MRGLLVAAWLGFVPALAGAAGFATLNGHGGPVKGIDVAEPGAVATASFDYSVGYWREGEPVWLEGHRAAVNAVLFLGDGRLASAGDDFDLRIWSLADGAAQVLSGHKGKIIHLDATPDARRLASASWDGTIGLWDLQTGDVRFLDGHDGPVNAVAFTADGQGLYSVSADGTLRLWDVATGAERRTVFEHGFGINTLVLAEEQGWLAYGAVDGGTRVIRLSDGAELADLTGGRRPILAMASPPDGSRLAIGDGEGYIMIVDTADWSVERDFRAATRGPVWALHYSRDGADLYAGGLDDRVFAWPVARDDLQRGAMAAVERSFLRDPATMSNGERQFQRKCSICHVLTGDTARRAGPTLEGLFGRPVGSVAGYAYSAALRDADFVWTAQTIDDLFEIGPDHYVPGTKMPMQKINAQRDRDDLIEFLRTATVPR